MPNTIAVISKKFDNEIARVVWLTLNQVTEDYALLEASAPVNLIEQTGIKTLPWSTKVYMFFKQWYNVFIFYTEDHLHAYCNIATPAKFENNEISFVDLDLDLIITQDRTVNLKDEDEFSVNKLKYSYPLEVEANAWKAVEAVREAVRLQHFPFDW